MNAVAPPLPMHRTTPSFAAVAEQHLDDVNRYLRFLTGDPGLAEDLAGETFERALRLWRRYDARRAGPKTWLCQIARSVALDFFRADERRRRREARYAETEPVAEAPSFSEGFSPRLQRALSTLTAGEREVLALCVVLDLERAAAARLLGISQTACTTRLSRALQKLEREMSDDDE